MQKIRVQAARDGTHAVTHGKEIVAARLSPDDAQNYAAFLRAAERIRQTQRLPR
ncbi:hypothetical protein [Methylobacterium oxalidis]|uniref:Uncharacterized protein n=1 Tax=Methylobacterium oxalidis TaxID=944322 RepID=A0A512JAF9_9HYPH|nr:hypothetical protein [Methylobacterium oxalidis]GEP06947.1 hypothetical protein MOX02_49850 [Methylobacterium oxalidis]GJE34170.1 hypothetical protein LDDCCGHA_4377 [Methylobacterium oxalidis]GLS64555.1 hypothetical protein GCM10007888_29360 [Methylobacterium oxalidis]